MFDKRTCIYSITVFLFAVSSVFLAAAQESQPAWQKVEGGRIRISLVPSITDEENDRPVYGVVELELEPGWKTYWSNPGNSGMAPDIVLEQEAKSEILFPAPQLLQSDTSNDNANKSDWAFGYEDRVLFPFRITELEPEMMSQYLSGYLLIGICKTLCVPEQIHFQFNMDELPDIRIQGRVKAALAALPKPARDNFRIKEATASKGSLHVLLQHPETTEAPSLFMDGQGIQPGIAEVTKHEANETAYRVPILSGKAVSGKELGYTAVIDQQAVSGKITID